MAETAASSPLKRQREEHDEQETMIQEDTKRQKPSSSSTSYNQVQCLLYDEEAKTEAEHDLASLITSLQQEISTEEENTAVLANPALSSSSCSSSSSSCVSKEDKYKSDKEKVMKHLLEASDDELGIPNTDIGGSNYVMINNETNQDCNNEYEFSLIGGFGNGLWELEDEAANYYTLLQSELFM